MGKLGSLKMLSSAGEYLLAQPQLSILATPGNLCGTVVKRIGTKYLSLLWHCQAMCLGQITSLVGASVS